ncbi:MAG: hypothetical protein A2452_06020 [Candidatus Firestonebacteria bacterium RIFOXYC2_FULL_39_67]|nr:MAG: hypothetical protein A2536_12445 [Candidatus Firestonebacteria bacterium RIFOXYD2_FULL_39_29]OGF56643.1 MAG: hypothetical protein A2452_06020 [Candidatus Firestonebacteria bacterium RIFOXYC2_FULL_39_67]OGF57119.1 MAG: hypothetical protein A2497_04565 [Candidatus Firestonebacteria bacterium RifOxyC12_full_39_7]
MGYYYGGFPRYESVGEKRAKAQKKLEHLKKKNPDITPLILQGNKLARTWWGIAWNTNLEKYADYSNRIGRGRSYIRNGCVLDFKISEGEVTSLVQGTRSRPYEVAIKIKPLKKESWNEIKRQCEGKIESLQELIEGRFPKDLMEIVTAKGKGLFPSPKEITFSCSCPDWASMCKHVAATLYGVGANLDDDPKLLFLLRKAEMDDLITEALRDKSKNMLKKAEKKTSRVINDADAGKMFGIDIDENTGSAKATKISKNKKPKITGKTKQPGKSEKSDTKKRAGNSQRR